MNKYLFFYLALLLPGFRTARAQDSTHVGCHVGASYYAAHIIPPGGHPDAVTLPGVFPSGAIETCGRVKVYYEDLVIALAGGPQDGFAETAGIGAIRRNTICEMLNYVQSVFDFSKIPTGVYLKLYVGQSRSASFHIGVSSMWSNQVSSGTPFFDGGHSVGDTVNGFAYDFLTSGTDPATAVNYHGKLEFNFDTVRENVSLVMSGFEHRYNDTIFINNGLDTPRYCQYDLYSSALHSMGHVLGYLNWFKDGGHIGTPALYPYYSRLSASIKIGPNPFSVYNPLATGTLKQYTGIHPVTDSVLWINDLQTPSNCGVDITDAQHLADQHAEYNLNNRISPGDRTPYVMKYATVQGEIKRVYTKMDLEVFHNIIGLSYNPAFATANATVLANHVPWSKKMSYGINTLIPDPEFSEKILPEYSIVNNTGSSLVMDLAADTNFVDADGDTLSVLPGSLHNISGCGFAGNNHALLTLSNANRTITFSPRADFYGKASFGFNLWDGKEIGAYILYTIDVKKGNNTTYTAGGNMVVNGNLEEGEEVKTFGNTAINNSIYFDPYFRPGRFSGNRADGQPYGNASAIRNSFSECGYGPQDRYGILETSFPWETATGDLTYILGIVTAKYPDAIPASGDRYLTQRHAGLYYLQDTMRNCRKYTLEFDAQRTITRAAVSYPAQDTLWLGFTPQSLLRCPDSIHLVQRYPACPVSPMKTGTWTHYKIPFTYCSDTLSTIMYLDFVQRYFYVAEPASIVLDNFKLVELPDTTRLVVNISDSLTGPCARRLYTDVPNLGCPMTYTWRKLDGSFVSNDPVINVNTTATGTYTVKVSNGCGDTASDTIVVPPCPCMPGAVFGTAAYDTLKGTIPATLGSGVYYVASDIDISSSPTTFTAARILIEPGVRITVKNNAALVLDSCHLLTCPDTNQLWKGILLESGSTTSGRIIVKGNSMIEDAEIAINCPRPKTPASSADSIILTNGAIFNRNRIGIAIDTYTVSSPLHYPFKIQNTVFTNRNLRTYSGYPMNWMGAQDLHAAKNTTAATADIAVEYAYSLLYPKGNQLPIAGIRLRYVGYTNSTATVVAGIHIGNPLDTAIRNLFDYTGDGIQGTNINLYAINNTFNRMVSYIRQPAAR